jgi:hypothetical protein
MVYMWFTGINYYKLAVEKDRDSIFTTIRPPVPIHICLLLVRTVAHIFTVRV